MLTQSSALADYFEETVRHLGVAHAKAASNTVMGDVLKTLNERGQTIEQFPIPPRELADLDALVVDGTISSAIKKDVFVKMFESGRSARDIVTAEGLAQNSDEGALVAIIERVMADNADAVAQYRAGQSRTFGFLVGQVMKGSGGKANPKLASQLLKTKLDN